MTHPAIRIEHLGKRYVLARRARSYTTFREALIGLAAAPVRRFRRLAGHSHSDEQFWALDDVSLDIEPGETLGIIGRNGAGKSTLLKILSRITEPTTGRARVRGRVGSLLEVGTGFHPELTGRENIFLNGAILGMSWIEIKRKFDEIVAFAEIERFLDTPVKHYSSGMGVRLAFSIASHLEPEILLVDEVLAVGDEAFQKKCLGRMGTVAQGGRTVLFVSHNMDAVKRLCRTGVWLSGGRIQFHGSADECVTHYLLAGHEESGRVEFRPPLALANHMPVSLLALELADERGTVRRRFSAAEPIRVRLQWELHERLYKPRIGFILYSTGAGEVFTALDAESWAHRFLDPGRYASSCVIPGQFLNEGSYALAVSGDTPNQHDFKRGLTDPLLGFDVDDDATLPNKYYGQEGFRDARWPGLVLPNIPWKQELLG